MPAAMVVIIISLITAFTAMKVHLITCHIARVIYAI